MHRLDLILFLPAIVSLFWSVTLFLNRKENFRSQNIWAVCLLVLGICTFVWAIYFGGVENFTVYYKLDIIDVTFTLLILPVVYYYFRSLTNKKKLTWKQYILLAPSFVIGAIVIVLYLVMGEEQSARYMWKTTQYTNVFIALTDPIERLQYFISVYVFCFILLLQVLFVMIYSTMNLIRYKKGLSNFFSNLNEKSIENNRAVLIGLYLLLFLALIAIVGWNLFYEQYLYFRYFIMGVLTIIFYYMSYHVHKIRFGAENLVPEPEESEMENIESDENYIKFLPQFIKLVEEDKIYLQSNLSLDDIARHINSNRTYISRLINDKYESNFYDLINNKRIEYAQNLASSNPHLTQEVIALESGFTHTSTFSRVFKKHTGITFREWQKGMN